MSAGRSLALRIAVATYGLALRACPAAFRRRHGEELEATFERRAQHLIEQRAALTAAAEMTAAVLDLLRTGIAERMGVRFAVTRGTRGKVVSGGDLRVAARRLARAPAFTAMTVGTLGLGIGSTTALFSIVDAVVLRPLPYADGTVVLERRLPSDRETIHTPTFSLPDAEDYRDGSGQLAALAVHTYTRFNAAGTDRPERVLGYRVGESFFEVLGVSPFLGTVPAPGEIAAGGAGGPVVLSHGFWQRHLGADPQAVGSTVTLDGEAYIAAAVMPPDFRFPTADAAVWVPRRIDPSRWRRDFDIFGVVARLSPGANPDTAAAELSSIARRLAGLHPESAAQGVRVIPLRDHVTGAARTPLLLLLGAVAGLLLIGCANVSGLLLVHTAARTREFALRRALGAGRGQVVRLVLMEGLLLALAGGALGHALAVLLLPALVAVSPADLPRLDTAGVDPSAVAFCYVAAVLCALASAGLPAWRAGGAEAGFTLARTDSRTTTSASGRRLREAMVAWQVATAVVLLVGATLLTRSFLMLASVDPGFRTERVLGFGLSLPIQRTDDLLAGRAFFSELLERLEALPGVESAGGTLQLPITGHDVDRTTVAVEGRSFDTGSEPSARLHVITPGYFGTLGVPVTRGRGFGTQDGPAAPAVALVNETFARRYLDGLDPVGLRIRPQLRLLPSDAEERTIVGVVADVLHFGLASEHEPQIYAPHAQTPWPAMGFVLRSSADPQALAEEVRAVVRKMNPLLPVADVQTLGEALDASLAPERFRAGLMIAIAGAALLLTTLGIYSLSALLVTHRTREIGLRLALGAQPGAVRAMVLRQGLIPVGVGLALGMPLALLTTQRVADLLFGVAPRDPISFLAVVTTIAAVSLGSVAWPAWRATQIDPRAALQSE